MLQGHQWCGMLRCDPGGGADRRAMGVLRRHVCISLRRASARGACLLTPQLSFLLFLIFFPRASQDVKPSDPLPPSPRTALLVALGCITHGAVTLILILYFSYSHPLQLASLSYAFGVLATLLAAIQYLPQIYTTWNMQAVGSLSIPMMCIQTPGSFVWVGSLAARLGWAGWSTWGIYLVTGCLQGWLLVMGIWFEMRARRQGGQLANGEVENESAEQSADERTRLLHGET